ncbi:hypothetical protein, partial [Salegentibacter sp.]|uniref:hypothetical protein n=1 Tax=Salegentibacter sp. TaxID=1903072 RepID=UPI003569323D
LPPRQRKALHGMCGAFLLVQGESLLSSRRANKKVQAGVSLRAFLCHFPTQNHRPAGGNPEFRS